MGYANEMLPPLREMDEPTLKDYMGALAGILDGLMPPGPSGGGRALFTLLVFDAPRAAQYVSNCDRPTMVRALREAADRLEAREDLPRR